MKKLFISLLIVSFAVALAACKAAPNRISAGTQGDRAALARAADLVSSPDSSSSVSGTSGDESSSSSSAVESSSPNSSSDDTSAYDSAVAKENSRHQDRLDAIDAEFDPQISALKTEIKGFQDEDARDTTKEIAKLQSDYDNAQSDYMAKYKRDIANAIDPESDSNTVLAKQLMDYYADSLTNQKPGLQKLQKDYTQLQHDQPQLATLQDQKKTAVSSENSDHASRLNEISSLYS